MPLTDIALSPPAAAPPSPARPPVIWMFTGQGAQYYQMGRELYDHEPIFRQSMDEMDEMVADYVGQSVVKALYDPAHRKSDLFDHIVLTNPALFMVQYSLARVLLARGVEPPSEVFGSSLGEFVATAVAGCQPLSDMLFDLIKKARLFDMHCQGGGMVMVLDQPGNYDLAASWMKGVEFSGYNFGRCFTLSGSRQAIDRVAKHLKDNDVSHQVLPVHIGFHSAQIDTVQDMLLALFSRRQFARPSINVTGCAVTTPNPEMTSEYWWQVIRGPIRFEDSVAALATRLPNAVWLDLGPAGNLATFARYNLPETKHAHIISTLTPFGRDLETVEDAINRLSSIR